MQIKSQEKERSVMRDRHLPRLCSECQAPMARQESACWRCGTRWASEDEPRTALRVLRGGASDEPHVHAGTQNTAPAPVAVESGGST